MSTVFSVILVLLLGTGTAARDGNDKKKKAEPTPTVASLTAKVPSLAPLAESAQLQTKGGLTVTVETVTYSAKTSIVPSDRYVNPSFKERLLMPYADAVLIERTYTPTIQIDPPHLRFQVHVSNQMPRVFRGSGIVVQFNVAGKIQAVDPTNYGDLENAIIPPRGEQTFQIDGPEVSLIPDQSTVGLFLYDVVTNTDAAGNVTDKQNFEWYFSYRCQESTKEISVPPPMRAWARPR